MLSVLQTFVSMCQDMFQNLNSKFHVVDMTPPHHHDVQPVQFESRGNGGSFFLHHHHHDHLHHPTSLAPHYHDVQPVQMRGLRVVGMAASLENCRRGHRSRLMTMLSHRRHHHHRSSRCWD